MNTGNAVYNVNTAVVEVCGFVVVVVVASTLSQSLKYLTRQ